MTACSAMYSPPAFLTKPSNPSRAKVPYCKWISTISTTGSPKRELLSTPSSFRCEPLSHSWRDASLHRSSSHRLPIVAGLPEEIVDACGSWCCRVDGSYSCHSPLELFFYATGCFFPRRNVCDKSKLLNVSSSTGSFRSLAALNPIADLR